ncbi:MAG: beta-ketoacyl-[acyl-carrier-protein] synthase family protein [Pseudomonadota bacterium]
MVRSPAADRPASERVVVTGMGAVSALGLDLPATWHAVLEGANGIRTVQRFDPAGFPVTFGAEVHLPGSPADLKGSLALRAAREALAAAGLPGGPRAGVFIGSEADRPPLSLVARRMRTGELPTTAEVARAAPWAPTTDLATLCGATGPTSTISTACSSSAQAIGEAYLRLRRGEIDVALTGGVDVLVDPLMVTGFAILGALSTRNAEPERACRPFDVDRDGFVLADGAAMLCLETLAHARARGAEVLGEILGYGCSLNAWRITDAPPDGRGAAIAMEAALADAGLCAADIDYVNAHGTSTPQNDVSEARALQRVLGPEVRRVLVSSTKSMTGHTVAACGALELLFSFLALRDGVAPPTINLDHPDPDCDLCHVAQEARPARLRNAFSNSFGFGGNNATLVVGGPS